VKKIRIPSAEGNQLTILLKKKAENIELLQDAKKKYEEAILRQ
jgi:hypothetical protein